MNPSYQGSLRLWIWRHPSHSCKEALGTGCWRGKARGLVGRCTREGEGIAWRGHGARVGRLLHPRVGHRVGGRLVTWDPHRTPCSRGSRSHACLRLRSADATRRKIEGMPGLEFRRKMLANAGIMEAMAVEKAGRAGKAEAEANNFAFVVLLKNQRRPRTAHTTRRQ